MLQTTTYKETPYFFGETYTKKSAVTKVRINYSTHGSVMPGQNYNSSYHYRYGYQGQFAEMDDESNESNFELRNYDPLLARFKTTDPYGQYWSPYQAMGNSHPNSIDPDGGFSFGGMIAGAAVGAAIGVGIDIANRNNMSGEAMFANAASWMAAGSLIGGFGNEINWNKVFTYTQRTVKEVEPVITKTAEFLWASRGVLTETYIHMRRVFRGNSIGATVAFDAFTNDDQIIITGALSKNLIYNSGFRGIDGKFNYPLPTTNPESFYIIDIFSGAPRENIDGGKSKYTLSKQNNSQRINTRTTKLLWGGIPFSIKSTTSYTDLRKVTRDVGTTIKAAKKLKFK